LSWLLPEFGSALTQAGNLVQAQQVLEAAVNRASELGEARYEAHALVCLLFARMQVDAGQAAAEIRKRFAALLATFTD
jgi:ABC-type molybdate transport system permease subunit